jgi:hypothetical protein
VKPADSTSKKEAAFKKIYILKLETAKKQANREKY